jgi:hypothetical protein
MRLCCGSVLYPLVSAAELGGATIDAERVTDFTVSSYFLESRLDGDQCSAEHIHCNARL